MSYYEQFLRDVRNKRNPYPSDSDAFTLWNQGWDDFCADRAVTEVASPRREGYDRASADNAALEQRQAEEEALLRVPSSETSAIKTIKQDKRQNELKKLLLVKDEILGRGNHAQSQISGHPGNT